MDLSKKFPLSDVISVVENRKCWWVFFDVDGYAPSDVDIIACASEELAREVKSWFKAMKDEDQKPFVVLNGKKYSELVQHGVEGYNWACSYKVREGVAETKEIMTSLAEIVTKGGIFEFEEDSFDPEGVHGMEEVA